MTDTDTKSMTVRLSVVDYDNIAALARENDRSVAAEIRAAIRGAVRARALLAKGEQGT